MSDQPTIILVHGAWHGAWCWDDVAEALRGHGFEVLTPDLPGHETYGSPVRIWDRLSSYVSHVDSLVQGVSGEVIVVGHSMGGLVTQRLLESRLVGHGILVASVPRKGVGAALQRLIKHDSAQVMEAAKSLSLWPMVGNDDRVRSHFFKEGADPSAVKAAGAKVQNESLLAFTSMIVRWPQPSKVSSSMTVVGATHDSIFTIDEQRDLAQAYGTELIEIDSGHDIMLEPQYTELVDIIVERANAT